MPKPSLARDFYDQIRNAGDPAAFIQCLVNSNAPTFEGDWLDFKAQPTPNLQDKKWRSMWIEALAGFANNEGGVLVWGLDARPDLDTKVDAACTVMPIDNPNAVKSRLIELQRQATDPPLGNVEIEAYSLPSAPGKGFVVCFVPEGGYKPYRTEDGKKSQFMIRAGDSFVVMSRSMIQSMFYPHSQAVFRVNAHLSWELKDKATCGGRDIARIKCMFVIINDGTATANNTRVRLSHSLKECRDGIVTRVDQEWTGLGTASKPEYLAHRPLHPECLIALFDADWEVKARAFAEFDNEVLPDCPAPSFELTIFCQNQNKQVIKIVFDTEEMRTHREGCYREAKAQE
jgi:hypothetical protein